MDASLRDADLTLAVLVQAALGGADMTGANLEKTDLSGAQFCAGPFVDGSIRCVQNLTQAQLDQAWAWSDLPPVLDDQMGLSLPRLCNPALRSAYMAANARGVPEGC